MFGFDSKENLVTLTESLEEQAWEALERRPKYEVLTQPRERPENVKEAVVVEREFRNIRLISEDVAEFEYSPGCCENSYRMVVLRKNLSIEKGESRLFDEVRYFFYITNDRKSTAAEIVFEANTRCNQENLIAQLHSGVRALQAPSNTLLSNWAYMVMTTLAWNLKAWFALMLPEKGRWAAKHRQEKQAVLKMEFKTFVNAFMQIPAQVIRAGRRIVFRLLSWNRWQPVFFRAVDRLHGKLICMTTLAWNLKAWFALMLPEKGRWAAKHRQEKQAVLKMEFKTFVNAFMQIPAQVIRAGRRIVFRLLSWNRWQPVFFRAVDRLHGKLIC